MKLFSEWIEGLDTRLASWQSDTRPAGKHAIYSTGAKNIWILEKDEGWFAFKSVPDPQTPGYTLGNENLIFEPLPSYEAAFEALKKMGYPVKTEAEKRANASWERQMAFSNEMSAKHRAEAQAEELKKRRGY